MKNITIGQKASITQALKKLKISGNKCLIVLDKNNILLGTLTDGDLRKKIINSGNTKGNIEKIYNKKPFIAHEETINLKKKEILSLFIKKKLSIIPLVKENKKFVKALSYENLLKKEKKIKLTEITCPVVIMAGGEGTRLKPFTNILPKPLMPIKDKTVIEKILLNFKNQGFRNFIITINYKSEILKAYFKELKLSVNINMFQEKKPLGTVGALANIKKLGKEFILTNCDNLYNFEFSKMLKFHRKNQNDVTICSTLKKIQIPFGVCEIKGAVLKKIIEKPKYNFLANSGVYVIKKSMIKFIKRNARMEMDEFLSILLSKNKKIGSFQIKENQWHDTGQWSELKKTIQKYS